MLTALFPHACPWSRPSPSSVAPHPPPAHRSIYEKQNCDQTSRTRLAEMYFYMRKHGKAGCPLAYHEPPFPPDKQNKNNFFTPEPASAKLGCAPRQNIGEKTIHCLPLSAVREPGTGNDAQRSPNSGIVKHENAVGSCGSCVQLRDRRVTESQLGRAVDWRNFTACVC